MKKMTKFFALALLAGAMVSCSTDDTTPSTQNSKVAVQFNGGINVSSRAVDAQWTANDRIGIFMIGANDVLSADAIKEAVDNVCYQTDGSNTFSPISGGKTIYFPIDGDVDFYSYYPQTTVNDYKVSLNVADQGNQEAIDFMYATKKGCNKSVPQVTLNFSHQLSKLVLDVQPGNGLTEDDLDKLTIKVKDQNSTATYNLVDGLISNEGTPTDITLKRTVAGKKYEAILLPTTEEKRVLEFDLNNGYDAPFVWTMPVKLKGGSKYHYTKVKLSRTAAEVSGTIEPWNEVKDDNEHIAK
mgnify:FL=1